MQQKLRSKADYFGLNYPIFNIVFYRTDILRTPDESFMRVAKIYCFLYKNGYNRVILKIRI